jgi:hypothetical protein
MRDISRFRALSEREQALVSVAVLLDGHDAPDYLSSDKERHLALVRASRDLAALPPDLRMPLAGSLLRSSLEKLS